MSSASRSVSRQRAAAFVDAVERAFGLLDGEHRIVWDERQEALIMDQFQAPEFDSLSLDEKSFLTFHHFLPEIIETIVGPGMAPFRTSVSVLIFCCKVPMALADRYLRSRGDLILPLLEKMLALSEARSISSFSPPEAFRLLQHELELISLIIASSYHISPNPLLPIPASLSVYQEQLKRAKVAVPSTWADIRETLSHLIISFGKLFAMSLASYPAGVNAAVLGVYPWYRCEAMFSMAGGEVCGLAREGRELEACGRCMSVRYCSQEHQKLDWKRHRPECLAPLW